MKGKRRGEKEEGSGERVEKERGGEKRGGVQEQGRKSVDAQGDRMAWMLH